jgi:hypothetical protein
MIQAVAYYVRMRVAASDHDPPYSAARRSPARAFALLDSLLACSAFVVDSDAPAGRLG